MHVHRVGTDALLVEVDTVAQAEALHAEVLRRVEAGRLTAVDVVPAARTVLLDELADRERHAREIPTWSVPEVGEASGPVVEIPVRYDGPDVGDVAAAWGVDVADVARLHQEPTYRVAFGGFAPGFGYLTGLPPDRSVPRRASPRTEVPAGSVALAGEFTGVYPRASPGGWQIVGTAVDVTLWDVARTPPALLVPGARVRFREVR
ncbi:5-oxoprolinase subunit B family protein [Paraoerskovia marina]|uniref:5-oxoprolinase subunit B family protein n=1 Tax=Paraoerskovia marina TaxID=545619 RepID=UPI0005BBDA7D|nr:allophanate hydrolase subunit 1 [Paraoerskovia marina]